jgi:hypothetical protein
MVIITTAFVMKLAELLSIHDTSSLIMSLFIITFFKISSFIIGWPCLQGDGSIKTISDFSITFCILIFLIYYIVIFCFLYNAFKYNLLNLYIMDLPCFYNETFHFSSEAFWYQKIFASLEPTVHILYTLHLINW